MISKLKAAFAIAKVAAKFAWLAPILAFISPVLGPLGPVVAGIFGAVVNFLKAALAGTFENLGTWNRIAASAVWICVALFIGVKVGIWAVHDVADDAFKARDQWKAGFEQLIADGEKARADEEAKFRAAVAAADKAAAREAARDETRVQPEVKHVTTVPIKRAPPVGASVKRSPDAKRVLPASKARRPAPAGADPDVGQGLLGGWVYSVFGPPLEAPPSGPKVGRTP